MAKTIRKSEDEITRNILNAIRGLQEESAPTYGVIKEEVEKGQMSAIAITDDARFGQSVLSNQISQFRTSVDSGAQFSKPEDGKVSESPLIFLPASNNLVFSGIIPRLNNLKFQFVLKTNTGCGCFIWADGVIINRENLETIQKLFGYYSNWCDEWNSSAGDLEQLKKMFQK